MTRKDVKWNWEERQQKIFEELKQRSTTKPVLVILDLDKEIRVEADMLNFAIGEVLLIKYEDEKQRLVAYNSKLLNKVERNYKIHDKKMLATIRCLEAWKHFSEGAKNQFKIQMNYKNLEYFMKAQKLNWRQAR